ncbi:Allophanate hydrolase [Paramyrothecium foliicola]|nr:Allophanate hydrolase [Paramyrothecium foliicola]
MAPAALNSVPAVDLQAKPSKWQKVPVTELEFGDRNVAIENLERLYAGNSVTPRDVVRSVYRRIAAYEDKAVWITLVPEAKALAAAEELEQNYPETNSRPPLYGIPFSVKDSIDIAGLPTTLACPTFAYTATQTAPVVQRILSAGGILIGKTNLDQFATGLNGTRSPYGSPRCVHDADYVSGGSSSGSVVSVAADLVSFAVATDTAGSTRVPAALNGVVGLKPTLGTISTVGLVPACKTADCITIIAKTVQTTRAALKAMRAYDENDVYARDDLQLSLLAAQPSWWDARRDGKVRYALPPSDLVSSVLSEPYLQLYRNVLGKLSTTGFMQEEEIFDYTPFSSANAMLYGSSIVSQRIVAFKSYLDSHGMDDLHPVIREIFSASDGFDAVRAYEDIFALAEYKRKAAKQFRSSTSLSGKSIDVLIVPSTATHPTVAEILADPVELNKRLGTFTHFVNLLDLCAVAVPVGGKWISKNGKAMPFSITLISTPGRDEDLLELGQRLMNEVGI